MTKSIWYFVIAEYQDFLALDRNIIYQITKAKGNLAKLSKLLKVLKGEGKLIVEKGVSEYHSISKMVEVKIYSRLTIRSCQNYPTS